MEFEVSYTLDYCNSVHVDSIIHEEDNVYESESDTYSKVSSAFSSSEAIMPSPSKQCKGQTLLQIKHRQ